jgi:signal transduction histidine kinase
MLTRFTIAQKSAVLSVLVSTMMGVTQYELLTRGTRPAIAIGVPLAVCCAVATGWAYYLVVTRMGAVSRAMRRVAAGELHARMPTGIDPERRAVTDAFNAMSDALDTSMRELRHADAQRRRLFADLAHELATPTSTLIGLAEALAAGPPDDERDMLLGHLDHEGARLERLVNDLRDLAHLDDPELRLDPVPTDLTALVRTAAAWAEATRASAIEVRCETTPVKVEADPLRIDQAVRNLLGNALRYTPPGGAIAITAGPHGDRARVVIDDAGAGVPDEVLPRLGERLLRLDPSRSRSTGGHGLGLSIVAAIVARHGGTLEFARSPLGGLRATIDLPASPDHTSPHSSSGKTSSMSQ